MNRRTSLCLVCCLAAAALPAASLGAIVDFDYTQTDATTGSGTISGVVNGIPFTGTMPAPTILSTYTAPPNVPGSAVGAIDALSGDDGGQGVYLGWSGTTTLTGSRNGPLGIETYQIDVYLQQVTGGTYSWSIDYVDDLGAGFDLAGNLRAAAYIGEYYTGPANKGHRHTAGSYITYTAGVADSYTYNNSLVPGGDATGDNLGIEAGIRDGTWTSGEILVDRVRYAGPLQTVTDTPTLIGTETYQPFSVYLDIGPQGQDVQTGHIPITGAANNANGVDLSPVVINAANVMFTLAIDDTDQGGADVGGIDWRDRGNSPNSGNDLVDLGEDFVKNNLGIIRVTLGGLPPGDYTITSFHLDPSFDQCEAIRIFLDLGAGYFDTGAVGNADFIVGIGNVDTDDVLATAATFSFTLTDPGDVSIIFDGTLALDDEVPLNGLYIDFVPYIPEPGTLALTALGLCGLLARRRRRVR